MVKIKSITIYQTNFKLKVPFTTSFGTETGFKRILVVIKDQHGNKGLGEIPNLNKPLYKPESSFATNLTMLQEYIVPAIKTYQKKNRGFKSVNDFIKSYSWIKGAPFAKHGVEVAFWHLLSQQQNKPLYKLFKGTNLSFDTGVSIGGKNLTQVLNRAEQAVSLGFKRLKVKVWPGFDIKVIASLRKKYPKIMLQVDANSAYNLKNASRLKKLDKFNLVLIEQPLADDDIIDHLELSKQLKTPICLDESIHSDDDARRAIHIWKQAKILNRLIINIKPSRVSGFTEALKIAKRCDKEKIKVWCGGMLESSWGKYFNLCFNARKELNLPGDHFAPAGEYFKSDILKEPLPLNQGVFTHQKTPEIDWKTINKLTTNKNTYKL